MANGMARCLHATAERYFSVHLGRRANYEDVFYLADQALAEETGEMENPAVRPFTAMLKRDMAPLLTIESGAAYSDLLEETCNYIADIVRCLCQPEAERTGHLKVFEEACEAKRVTGISTLCHDTHVEHHLRGRGLLLADGFSEDEAGVRYWNRDLSASEKIPFLKLHGSVDWYRLRPDGAKPWYDDRIGIPRDGDPDHTKTRDGTLQTALDGRPILLIGTFNKITDYSRGIFRDLHFGFRSSIRDADKVVVCGYSFGDKGINSEVIEWLYDKRERQIVVIHPEPEKLAPQARAAIRNKWEEWESRGAVIFIRKKIEDVESNEFFNCIET